MKFIGHARAAFLAFREGSVVRMEPNSFHSAHPAATGASLPGITVPDEFHELFTECTARRDRTLDEFHETTRENRAAIRN